MRGQFCVLVNLPCDWGEGGKGTVISLNSLHDSKVAWKLSTVEIIYISCDRDQPGFEHYYCKHPWLALPFSERDVKARLSSKYGVDSYPTLVFITKNCEVITKDGRSAIRDTDFQRTGDASEIKDDDEVGANISEALRDLKLCETSTPHWEVGCLESQPRSAYAAPTQRPLRQRRKIATHSTVTRA